MRKLVAVLLALCQMCGACVIAGAEEDNQLYTWSIYSYEFPADWDCYEGVRGSDYCYAEWWYAGDDVSIDKSLNLNYQPRCMRIMLERASRLIPIYLELPELLGYKWPYRSASYIYHEETLQEGLCFAWGEHDSDGATEEITVVLLAGPLCMHIQVYYDSMGNVEHRAEIQEHIIENYVVPLFKTVKISGQPIVKVESTAAVDAQEDAATESVQTVNGKQTVQLANATFELDANIVSSKNNGSMFEGANDRYSLTLMFVDWEAEGIDISVTGDEQMDNAFWCSYLLFEDQQIASTIAAYGLSVPCGMPDGGDVLFLDLGEYVVLTHYYRNTGFMMLISPVSDADRTEMLRAAEEIAKSFRLEGMTEEEMRNEAAAEAEAAAAKKYVVITADSGKIRTEASISGGLIKTAYKGETFELIEQSGDWYVVKVDGRTGYIHSGVAEIQ